MSILSRPNLENLISTLKILRLQAKKPGGLPGFGARGESILGDREAYHEPCRNKNERDKQSQDTPSLTQRRFFDKARLAILT
jgi:hypothetical protein